MSEPKLPSWMNYSDYEDIMHYLRLFGEMKPYYLKAEDVFNAEQEVMKRKIDDGLRLIDVAKEMIWSYKYKERWHQLPKDENMDLTEAKKILKDAGFLVENIDDASTREELIELILEDPCRDENITLEILKTWSLEELEKYHEECEERYLDDVYGKDRDGIDEAKELLENNGYIVEWSLDGANEEMRLEHFGEYLYEVRELLVRKGFSRGKQADNYDELHDIAHRCCRLGKSIEDCAKEIILTIK